MELSNDLLGLEVRFIDLISDLFGINVNMTYGNTSLQIALFPLWNSYQYHTYRVSQKSSHLLTVCNFVKS